MISNTLLLKNLNKAPVDVMEQLQIFVKEPERRSTEEMKRLLPLMKSIRAFRELDIPDAEYMRLLFSVYMVVFDPKQTIFKAGEAGDCFYIVLHGEVELWLANPAIKPLKKL